MNRYGHTPDDILAVKNISSQIPGQLVYLGALSAHHGGGHPGRWSTWRDAWLPTPATWDGGGVGDLLAVTTPTNVSQLATYHGRLLVLFQQGRYTHLGIARSGSLVLNQAIRERPAAVLNRVLSQGTSHRGRRAAEQVRSCWSADLTS